MRLKTILLTVALASVTLIASSHPLQAQVCPKGEVVPPSQQTRIIRSDLLNYRFNIPRNYRTMLFRGNVLIYDPATFAQAQCYVKNRVPSELPRGVSVYIKSVNPESRNVTDLVKEQLGVEMLEPTTVANQSAIVYNTDTLGRWKNISFLTPDRRHMITIAVPYQYSGGKWVTSNRLEEVFKTVVSSFTFV
jgi:hypothetical protein